MRVAERRKQILIVNSQLGIGIMISATEELAVREWVKVPNIPGLYRNVISGRYYGPKRYAAGGENTPYARQIAKLPSDDTANGSPTCNVWIVSARE